jgi:hypothetical protein
LLHHCHHLCARRARSGECRDQQRPAAGNHDPLATHRHAAFDERLQRARAGHAGQGPAGERQKPLMCAGRQDQVLIGDADAAVLRRFEQQAA